MAARLIWASRATSYLRISNLLPSPGHSLISTVIQELKSVDTHEWVKVDGTSAIDHLGEVVYVELPEVGAPITQGNSCGVVESVKATSEVISPVSGKVIKVNEKLSHSPGLVNSSPEGWILKVEVSEEEAVKFLMGSEKYSKFCEEEMPITECFPVGSTHKS